MTFLPIAERELRVAARRRLTFWIRWMAALVCLGLWLVMAVGNRHVSPAEFAKTVFTAFGILAFAFVLLAGIFLTADCLSEEKREGTLGLLFLTDLKGHDVVIGKLAATSMHALYALLAIFPIMALPLLMGGVTAGEFWRLMLVLLVTLLLSLGIGMLSSAIHRETRQSIAAVLLALVVLAGVLPALWWLNAALFTKGRCDWLLIPSPAFTLRAAYDFSYSLRNGPHQFWTSLLTLLLMALGCLALAAGLLPRVWQDRDEGRPAPQPAALNPTTVPPAPRRRVLDDDPCFWLARRDGSIQRTGRLLIFLLLCVWAAALFAAIFGRSGQEPFIVSLFVTYGLHQLGKWFMTIEATRQLHADRRSGALELLLVTPVTEHAILAGHARAFRERFRPLTRLLVAVPIVMSIVVLCSSNLSMNSKDRSIFLELFLGGTIVLFFDRHAIIKIGVLAALRSKKHGQAVLSTLLRVLAPPWAAIFLMIFLMQNRAGSAATAAMLFAMWFGFGIATDLVFTSVATIELRKGIRVLISEPGFSPPTEPLPQLPVALAPVKA